VPLPVHIHAKNPSGGDFGLTWSAITRWEAEIASASSEFGVPAERIMATIVIESGGNPRAIQRNPSNGDSYGLMQVVPRWWITKIQRLAGPSPLLMSAEGCGQAMLDSPLLAIRVGASILNDFRAQHGTWDRASSAFFLGNPDWRGADTVNGNTGAGYRTSLNALMEEITAANPPQPGAINWESLPRPQFVRAIVDKPYNGAGFDRLTKSRGPQTVGCCNHITDGDPSGDEIEWYRAFFSTGGERATDALVDTVIARNGQIGLLNDWEDPNFGGTRAGWANGGPASYKGDGIKFVNTYPYLNAVLVSKEHVARSGQALTDAQMAASIALSAYVAQKAKVRYDTYPLNDRGVNIEQLHRNFTNKACPDEPFISTYYPILKQGVKDALTLQQTGSTNPGTPPPPEVIYPFGFTLEAIDYFWGTLIRYDGAEIPFDPSPQGVLSKLWLDRCAKEATFPEAEQWVQFGTRDVVTWEGGWTAVRDNTGQPWKWLEEVQAA
jgi:hypothetical protein